MKTKLHFATIVSALFLGFVGGCGKSGDAPASASISWIHPRLPQATQPVAITNASTLARLPKLFPGYDGPPPNTPPSDPPMYDCIIAMTKADGTRTDIKIYLPRMGIFSGMWRHPKGQLLSFEDDAGKQILELVAPYVPKQLQSEK